MNIERRMNSCILYRTSHAMDYNHAVSDRDRNAWMYGRSHFIRIWLSALVCVCVFVLLWIEMLILDFGKLDCAWAEWGGGELWTLFSEQIRTTQIHKSSRTKTKQTNKCYRLSAWMQMKVRLIEYFRLSLLCSRPCNGTVCCMLYAAWLCATHIIHVCVCVWVLSMFP